LKYAKNTFLSYELSPYGDLEMSSLSCYIISVEEVLVNYQDRHPDLSHHYSFRKPSRISITIPDSLYKHLVKKSVEEGRSLSNLSAFLIESALRDEQSSSQYKFIGFEDAKQKPQRNPLL
jgi:hypothetical protein